MQQDSFAHKVLGSVLYIRSGLPLKSVSLIKQAVSRKDRLLFHFRTEGVDRHAEAAVLFFMSALDRKIEKQRASWGECERRWRGGFVRFSQIKVSRSRNSLSVSDATKGRGNTCSSLYVWSLSPKRTRLNYRLLALVSSSMSFEETTLRTWNVSMCFAAGRYIFRSLKERSLH